MKRVKKEDLFQRIFERFRYVFSGFALPSKRERERELIHSVEYLRKIIHFEFVFFLFFILSFHLSFRVLQSIFVFFSSALIWTFCETGFYETWNVIFNFQFSAFQAILHSLSTSKSSTVFFRLLYFYPNLHLICNYRYLFPPSRYIVSLNCKPIRCIGGTW